jgi:hypothetical protein
MNEHIQLTSLELKEIVYGIHSLNQQQRELVHEVLEPYVGKQLWKQDFKKMLWKLKDSHQLSEIDIEGVMSAFFPG